MGATASNSADGMMLKVITTLACGTGAAFTIAAPTQAMMVPATTLVMVPVTSGSAAPVTHPAWAELESDLLRWEVLPNDWDGDDGIAPPHGSIAAASHLIGKLKAAHIAPPEASVSGDGEIAYNWSKGTAFASIALLADGHIVAYSRVAGHPTIEMDERFDPNVDLLPMFESLRDLA